MKKRLFSLLLVVVLSMNVLSTSLCVGVAATEIVYYDNVADAAEVVREGMVNRTETVVVYYTCSSSDNISSIMREIVTEAMEHTGVPDEGDYLLWSVSDYKGSASYIDGGTTYYLTITYTITYYTTADQEAELTAKLKTDMESLDLDSKCDYQKVVAIHDYICRNVSYDYTNLNDDTYTLKYTAYAALINGNAVCQGYAALFYRMALMAGLDVRYISGTATNSEGDTGAHGWNIVKIGNTYYNIDTTWDDGTSSELYFLKGSTTFDNDHVRDTDYTTEAFTTAYPVPATDYDTNTEHSWGTPALNWEDDCSACTATFTCSRGDGTVTVDCTVTSGGKDATCTTDGSKSYTATCTFNGTTYSDTTERETVPATGHSWDEGTVTTAATCTETGVMTYTCTVCDETKTETIPATGHTESESVKENEVAATCTKEGSYDSVVYCSVCG
ncbi:MAG: hypothetical protein LUD44_06410, partial [Firmicutes bacterium]|nr:hypothetical protein [Bacillota bacterium]